MNDLEIQTDIEEYRERVGSLMNSFRESLLSLLPSLETHGINWKDIEGIDEFDSVAESLFNFIVTRSIQDIIDKQYGFIPELPNYGFFYKNFSKLSYIAVIHLQEPTKRYVFNYLASKNEPFDTIICNQIDNIGKLIERDIQIPISDVVFGFYYRNP